MVIVNQIISETRNKNEQVKFCFSKQKKKKLVHLIYFSLLLFGVGSFWEVLHNSYVKGGLALGALLGPGRGQ